jgi:hypothetical protein
MVWRLIEVFPLRGTTEADKLAEVKLMKWEFTIVLAYLLSG